MVDDGDPPLGTIQLPRGVVPATAGAPPAVPNASTSPAPVAVSVTVMAPSAATSLAGFDTAKGAPPTMPPVDPSVAPVLATVVPTSVEVMDTGAPPELPAPWRYELRAEIARGGMGRVVEAADTVLGRVVALKEALARDPDALRRFERETRITARLEHPSIVPVHDAGTSPNGAPFYVMRKIGGRPLEELVGKYPELADRLALLPNMVAACNAIAHAHKRGVVHRDIKPSNILVGELGETMMIDWGLAKALGEPEPASDPASDPATAFDPDAIPTVPPPARDVDPNRTQRPSDTARVYEDAEDIVKTRVGVVFGTPGFLAPEQLRGAPSDERCDVYALGATLYHLLARRPPHYSKNAADMMRAAVTGPPEPLHERVPGVPRELETIIDKALAFDRAARYPDALSLADDLQRFIGGQLVASHHYSSRERWARWLRKNRAPVGVAAVATVALLVFGTFAISRVVAARNAEHTEAVKARKAQGDAETARGVATDRLQRLRRATARIHVADDPARAVAIVKDPGAVIDTGAWREVRAIASAARAAGVPVGYPASAETTSLELGADGMHALTAGGDGVIRLYDFARHATAVVGHARPGVHARFADAEHSAIWFAGTSLTVANLATNATRDVTTPSPIAALGVSGPIVYWVDPQHVLWKLDVAGGVPIAVDTDEPIVGVYPSPDGRWVALAGQRRLYLLDRTSTAPPQVVEDADGVVRTLEWASDNQRMVMLTESPTNKDLVEVSLSGAAHVDHRYTIGERTSIAHVPAGTYGAGPTGVALMSREIRLDEAASRVTANDVFALYPAWNGALVAARPSQLALISDDGDRALASPARITHAAASPRGPYAAASVEHELLVWDLSAVLPAHAPLGDADVTGARFASPTAVIASLDGAPAAWLDVRTGKALPLGELEPLAQVAAAPDGQHAIVVDGAHRGRIVAPVGEPLALPGEVIRAGFVSDRHAAVAFGDGLVGLVAAPAASAPAPAPGAAPPVADVHELIRRSRPTALVVATGDAGESSWLVAAFADRSLWRCEIDAHGNVGSVGSATLPAALQTDVLALGIDGELYAGAGNELYAWHAAGEPVKLWSAPAAIVKVALADPAHLLVQTGLKLAFVETATGTAAQLDLDVAQLAVARPDAGLAALLTAAGTVELLDLTSREHWQISPHSRNVNFTSLQLAPDGSRVLALLGTQLRLWTLALPTTADALAAWLPQLSNAATGSAEDPTGPLEWK